MRLNRGAGAGSTIPPTSTKVARWRLWGWWGASPSDNTGVTHASVPSNVCSHSSRVLAAEDLGDALLEGLPLGLVVLRGDVLVGEAESCHERPVEPGLHGPDGHELTVGCLVHVVVVGAGVHGVGPAFVVPQMTMLGSRGASW